MSDGDKVQCEKCGEWAWVGATMIVKQPDEKPDVEVCEVGSLPRVEGKARRIVREAA